MRQFTKGVRVRHLRWRPVPKHGSTNNVLDWEGTPDRHKKQQIKVNSDIINPICEQSHVSKL